VLLTGALLAAGCALPGRVTGPVELTATFDDVGDLVAGHSVQVADVRIGSIMKIELTDDYRATVTMKIKDGLDLPGNSTAVLRTTSLLGEKFVELRPPAEGDTGCVRDGVEIGPILVDEAEVYCTDEAPELEFVAEEAVSILASVAHEDLRTIIETGAVGFGGRAVELGRIVDNLATVSGTLAGQTSDIVAIIDGLDSATSTLAGGADRVDALLVNLARTTDVLADNRELTLQTLRDLTRLAQAQNELVFEPYQEDVKRQIQQLDAVLALVAEQRGELTTLVDWLVEFTRKTPLGVPEDFAQIYGWLEIGPLEDGQ
jgi:phospholipid/cholesterol/gamma-HCH transport system substrate-binding protein